MVADEMLAAQDFNRADECLPPIAPFRRTGDVVCKEDRGTTKRRPPT